MRPPMSHRLRRLAVVAVGVLIATSAVVVALGTVPADALPAPVVLSTVAITRPASVIVGGSGQAATNWGFTFSNGFAKGDTLVLNVGPPGTTACQSSANSVGYASIPTVTVTPGVSGQDTPPAITATVAQQATIRLKPSCAPGSTTSWSSPSGTLPMAPRLAGQLDVGCHH